MKKFLRCIIPIFFVILIMPTFTLRSYAVKNLAKGFDGDTSKSGIEDNRELFSSVDCSEIERMIESYSEKLQMNLYIFVAGSEYSHNSDRDTEIFADNTYDRIFGENTDGVFYYLDMSGKSPAYDYVSTSGKAVLMYQDNLKSMLNEMNTYLPASGQPVEASEIRTAIEHFCKLLTTRQITKHGISSYYRDKSSGKNFYYSKGEYIVSKSAPPFFKVVTLAVSCVIGIIVGVICFFSIKSSYKFKSSAGTRNYVSENTSRFTHRSDTFIRTYTTKHHIQTNSGGSGGSGGGGHSFDGGHGGGGSHR